MQIHKDYISITVTYGLIMNYYNDKSAINLIHNYIFKHHGVWFLWFKISHEYFRDFKFNPKAINHNDTIKTCFSKPWSFTHWFILGRWGFQWLEFTEPSGNLMFSAKCYFKGLTKKNWLWKFRGKRKGLLLLA